MLILTRRPDESIVLSISEDIDPTTPISEVLNHPIEITPLGIKGNQIKLGIHAPDGITILREEISEISCD